MFTTIDMYLSLKALRKSNYSQEKFQLFLGWTLSWL